MTYTSPPDLSYIYHVDTGIHAFTFHKSNRAAVDNWLAQMDAIYADKTPDDSLMILIDLRQSGTLPLSYIFTRATKWVRQLRVHPHVRMALINKPGENILTALSDKFLKTMRLGHLETANFYGQADDKALDWLLNKG